MCELFSREQDIRLLRFSAIVHWRPLNFGSSSPDWASSDLVARCGKIHRSSLCFGEDPLDIVLLLSGYLAVPYCEDLQRDFDCCCWIVFPWRIPFHSAL